MSRNGGIRGRVATALILIANVSFLFACGKTEIVELSQYREIRSETDSIEADVYSKHSEDSSQELNSNAATSENVADILHDYFLQYYQGQCATDIYADVTHDLSDDLIVVGYSKDDISPYVFMEIYSYTDKVQLIYASDPLYPEHTDGYTEYSLIEENQKYQIVRYCEYVWQGYGNAFYEKFNFEDGNINVVDQMGKDVELTPDNIEGCLAFLQSYYDNVTENGVLLISDFYGDLVIDGMSKEAFVSGFEQSGEGVISSTESVNQEENTYSQDSPVEIDGKIPDKAECLSFIEKAAEEGNAKAMYFLGHDYIYGRWLVQYDEEKGVEWYKKSAELGDLNAINDLAGLYEHGIGVERNEAKAEELKKKRIKAVTEKANTGDLDALYELWEIYECELNNKKKSDEIFARIKNEYEKLINAGDANAMYSLGMLYYRSRHKEPQITVELVERAANAGNSDAMYSMGIFYKFGNDGLPKDYTKAVKWLQKSVDAGNINAMNALAEMYMFGIYGVPEDVEKATELYKKANELKLRDTYMSFGSE